MAARSKGNGVCAYEWPAKFAVPAMVLLMILAVQPSAKAQTYTVIHNFAGGLDGSEPSSGVTIDRAGNLYGSTFEGDAGTGTVYKLTHRSGGWVLTPLYYFSVMSNGTIPYDRPTFGPNGSIYVSTGYGGIGPCVTYNGTGCGTMVNLQPPITPPVSPTQPWLETVLYKFSGGSDGANPYSGDIIFDQAGNIYGTTFNGGSTTNCPTGCGVVYKLVHGSGGWTETVLHSFNGSDGTHPWAGVTFDSAGNLYGTTSGGGANGFGTVFELSPSGGSWTLQTLHSFEGGNDGAYVYAGLIFDGAGNLYGATASMGSGTGGTVFELSPSGGGWTYNRLYSFAGPNGGLYPGPVANLAFDQHGSLYGTTHLDGAFNFGAIFKLTNSGSGWTYTSLHDFTAGLDGGYPRSNITFDSSGNMYGTAAEGGSGNLQNCVGSCGVIFEMTP
ncbi:MAG TPA: choice-of-anchor tandem repeat GloVer-containing protein [Terriglobales bacterium]|nr:choice-of-anchor tandem repeat GloVer-containing protein [Terriglobales bacterium]